MPEITTLDATAQAELVRKKEVSPEELLDASIERVERLNPAINCVVTSLYDEARAAIKAGLPDGPFTGVPYMLKDLFAAYAGTRMTFGSNLCENFISPHDSELVARLKRAGLVIMGKTSTPEFGILPTTEPHRFGPCRNPWNTDHSVGGSSGGSAAAVACGMVPAAHGNDGGGSIRIPASCCGLFGLKPTRGRNPLGPDVGDVQNGLVSEHALTRTVRDSAALLDATAGPDIGDPYYAPPQERPYTEELKRDPGKLRIAFSTIAPTGVPVHDDCIAAVHNAAKLCESLGHHVEEVFPSLDGPGLFHPFVTVFSAGPGWAIDGMALAAGVTPSQDKVEPLSWAMYEQMQQVSCTQYLLSITYLQQVARQIAHFMKDYDLLLTPTVAQPPLPIGSYDSPDDPMHGFMVAGMFAPFTPLCNFTGQPAMNVPLHWNAEGLPIGSHFVARFGDEATLFRLAAQLETARPWITKQPPIFG
ncbi:MAG: amidase [Candidatus Hydrogenedentes bacterium]|nr:amidase [Candidatus Hydrogenedentota bacterium]